VAARPERIVTAIAGNLDGFHRSQLTSYWEAVDWANGHLPPSARVLVYGDRRCCPLARRFLIPSFAEPAPFLAFAAESRDEAQVWRKLRQAGVTHILYNRTAAVFGRARLAGDLPGLGTVGRWARGWKAHARLVYESPAVDVRQGMFYIYALDGPPGPGASIVLPGIEGWLYIPERLAAEGRNAEAREVMGRLTAATGDFAVIDAARASMLPPMEACAALNRAAVEGFRSVTVYEQLAACRDRAGDFTGARLWRRAAAALAWPGNR
jgi:hypothetical protein